LSPADFCKQTLIHERGLTCCAFNDEEPGQANQNRRKSFAWPFIILLRQGDLCSRDRKNESSSG
jgi:hypothetical protein